MKYDVVKRSLEQWIAAEWAAGPNTQIQYDNVAIDIANLTEYMQFTVRFGEAIKRSLPVGCYRQFGIILFSAKTKPDRGSARKLQLATLAAEILLNAVVTPVTPLVAPTVNLREPDLFDDTRERDGWVMAQVSCPFYYDLEY